MDANINNHTHLNDIDMLAAPPVQNDPLLDFANALPSPVPPTQQHSGQPPPLVEEATAPTRPLDDVERMLCHEHFPALLAKATKVKTMREAMNMDSAPSASSSMLDPNHVIAAVTRMQGALSNNKGTDMPVVRKGTYPLTDSMLEEQFEILQKEAERCEAWNEQRKQNAGRKKRNADGEAIAVKYAKWQTDVLMDWMIEHKDHPFPDSKQIKVLGDKTGLTHSQIVNWTTNVRKRNLKATVEGGKKPHHFIDFVFLAHDRESREAQGLDPRENPAPAPPAKKAPARRKKKKKASSKAHKSNVAASSQYHSHAGAFRPYPGGPVYYPAPPHHQHHSMQEQQPPNGGYHHPYYQHPFPPPPYAYHPSSAAAAAPPVNDEWEHKLGVVSESFDNDGGGVDPVMSMEEENPETLASFADYWKDNGLKEQQQPTPQSNDEAFEALNSETKSLIKQVDVIAAATLEQALMADPIERTPQQGGRDSLNSIEMIDLDNSNCFLDEYDFAKNMTEI